MQISRSHLHPLFLLLVIFAFILNSCGPISIHQQSRQQFFVSFRINQLGSYDSRSGIFIKDIFQGQAITRFYLTQTECDSIATVLQSAPFMALPDTLTRITNDRVVPEFVFVSYQAREKLVSWYNISDDYFLAINKVLLRIRRIIEARPEYQALPSVYGKFTL